MSNSGFLTEYAQLLAEIKQLSSQMAETLRSDSKREDYPDIRSWMAAVKSRTAQADAQSHGIRELEMRLRGHNQVLINLSLSLLAFTELPAADISQQLDCSEESAAVLQRFVAQNLNHEPVQESQRSKPSRPVPFPGS